MKRKLKYVLLVIFVLEIYLQPTYLFSQAIKVVKATSQGWAGGVCCRSGINYNIQLRISDKKKQLKLDSLWMDGTCTDISRYYHVKTDKTDSTLVVLQEGVAWDDGMPMDNWCFDAAKKVLLFLITRVIGKNGWMLHLI